MSTALNFDSVVDLPRWRSLSQPITTASVNYGLISDFRNNEDRHPFIYFCNDTTIFNAYSVKNDEWLTLSSPALATSFTSGFFMSGQGPRGTIAAGATTTSIILTTALPSAVGTNSLANRGDGIGFKIRIIGNATGGSGKTEERYVVANTTGTTPTINLDSPLSFTPIAGDAYEFLSGRVYMLGNTNAAGSFEYYDILTNSFSGSLDTTALPASWTNSNLVGLDELLVPYDRNPGEGFLGVMISTASTGTSFTGQSSGGDSRIVADQYRNFQIRIIEDTAIPTAVGQRRNITTHTAGPFPIYTVSTWTVQPSAIANYVIENNGDRILAFVNGTTQTSTYSIAGNIWDANTTFAARPAIPTITLMSHQAFSIEPDVASPPNVRQSYIYSFRGSGSNMDIFDIAGAATGLWANSVTYGNSLGVNFSNQVSSTQDPATNQGRYIYIDIVANVSPTSQRLLRFDMKNTILEPFIFLRIPVIPTTTNTSPKRLGYTVFVDGSTKLSFIFYNVQNADGTTQLLFNSSIIT